MGHWNIWLENRLRSEDQRKLKELWNQTFQALGIDGLNDIDALSTSLSNIEYNKRTRQPPIKGGTAALKLLHNANIFRKLSSVNPDMSGSAQQAEDWLNKISSDGKAGGSTVGDFMQKLFGDKFNELSGDDTPDLGDDAKAEVPAQLPKPDSDIDNNIEEPDIEGMPLDPNMPQAAPGQPVNQQQQPPPPPMPKPPMGVQQGLF